jgi:hypothetical protein
MEPLLERLVAVALPACWPYDCGGTGFDACRGGCVAPPAIGVLRTLPHMYCVISAVPYWVENSNGVIMFHEQPSVASLFTSKRTTGNNLLPMA